MKRLMTENMLILYQINYIVLLTKIHVVIGLLLPNTKVDSTTEQ
jgi:hypothetical protein